MSDQFEGGRTWAEMAFHPFPFILGWTDDFVLAACFAAVNKCEMTALLLARGASTSPVNKFGLTPRQEAKNEIIDVYQIYESKVKFLPFPLPVSLLKSTPTLPLPFFCWHVPNPRRALPNLHPHANPSCFLFTLLSCSSPFRFSFSSFPIWFTGTNHLIREPMDLKKLIQLFVNSIFSQQLPLQVELSSWIDQKQ